MRVPDDFDTVIRLRFQDPRLAGFDVRLRRSFALVDSGAQINNVDAEALQAGRVSASDLAVIRQLVDDFAAALVSWNLTDDQDQPLSTDREAVRALDIMLVLMLIASFMQAITTLREEIAALASQLDEAEIPMEPAVPDA